MKRVLVTGASKGIGRAIAIELAGQGYDVLIHYNSDKDGAEKTLESIKTKDGKGSLISFNIGDRESVKEKIYEDIEKNGTYYGIVCNAGIARDSIFPTMSDDEWDDVININLNGFYNVVKPCVMPMIKERSPGRIVVVSSVSGVMGNRGQVNYSASKAGLIGASKALATELAKKNITVNCVAPGLIETEMLSPEIVEHAKNMIPMQRVGKVHEVSGLVTYLMSDSASYLTRQVISINGGMY